MLNWLPSPVNAAGAQVRLLKNQKPSGRAAHGQARLTPSGRIDPQKNPYLSGGKSTGRLFKAI